MSYPLFDKDEHWHKPEQAFLTDDHRTILRFAVEALMSGKGAVLVTLVEIRGGAARPARGADGGARRWSLLRFCLWRLRGGRCRF
ncbi:xanthine dehydrogenase accessory factor [Escherichia coli]|nr:xanthine dehydrogenase accessory factor [Escherichia coli]